MADDNSKHTAGVCPKEVWVTGFHYISLKKVKI